MADISGVFAKIKMTETAVAKFYQEQKKPLLTDYFCIQDAYQKNVEYYNALAKLNETQNSENPFPQAVYENMMKTMEELRKPANENCNAEDLLIIQYDAETQSLFYFHLFRWDHIENLKTSVSLQTFLCEIANYKDVESEDYIFFSDCATCLLDSQFFKIWKVQTNDIQELELKEWNPKWNEKLDELDALSKKYYFDIVEKYITHDAAQGISYIDDEGLDLELEQKMIDAQLLKNH